METILVKILRIWKAYRLAFLQNSPTKKNCIFSAENHFNGAKTQFKHLHSDLAREKNIFWMETILVKILRIWKAYRLAFLQKSPTKKNCIFSAENHFNGAKTQFKHLHSNLAREKNIFWMETMLVKILRIWKAYRLAFLQNSPTKKNCIFSAENHFNGAKTQFKHLHSDLAREKNIFWMETILVKILRIWKAYRLAFLQKSPTKKNCIFSAENHFNGAKTQFKHLHSNLAKEKNIFWMETILVKILRIWKAYRLAFLQKSPTKKNCIFSAENHFNGGKTQFKHLHSNLAREKNIFWMETILVKILRIWKAYRLAFLQNSPTKKNCIFSAENHVNGAKTQFKHLHSDLAREKNIFWMETILVKIVRIWKAYRLAFLQNSPTKKNCIFSAENHFNGAKTQFKHLHSDLAREKNIFWMETILVKILRIWKAYRLAFLQKSPTKKNCIFSAENHFNGAKTQFKHLHSN